MKAKTKTKTKKITKATTVKKITRVKNTRQHFHVSYLAVAIIMLLILEGLLFTFSSQAAWKEGVSILDMGPAISETVDDLAYTLAPVTETVSMVNKFYSLATDAAMELLDLKGSETELLLVINSVTDFYIRSSIAMEELITITPITIRMPQVAGTSISN